jgi:hypothetical protein
LEFQVSYTTYATYWKVGKAVADDPEYDTRKARVSIARFVSLHPHNLAQKAELIVEHFREHTRRKVAGRGKAMVVTSSRLHAVRYKGAIDAYLAEKGYADTRALVAFSGRVDDAGLEYETGPLHGRPSAGRPRRLDTLGAHDERLGPRPGELAKLHSGGRGLLGGDFRLDPCPILGRVGECVHEVCHSRRSLSGPPAGPPNASNPGLLPSVGWKGGLRKRTMVPCPSPGWPPASRTPCA